MWQKKDKSISNFLTVNRKICCEAWIKVLSHFLFWWTSVSRTISSTITNQYLNKTLKTNYNKKLKKLIK